MFLPRDLPKYCESVMIVDLRVGDIIVEHEGVYINKRHTVKAKSLCAGTRGNIHIATEEGKLLCYWGETEAVRMQ
jgi:hypothetical protein